jgi:hypothetical protein
MKYGENCINSCLMICNRQILLLNLSHRGNVMRMKDYKKDIEINGKLEK